VWTNVFRELSSTPTLLWEKENCQNHLKNQGRHSKRIKGGGCSEGIRKHLSTTELTKGGEKRGKGGKTKSKKSRLKEGGLDERAVVSPPLEITWRVEGLRFQDAIQEGHPGKRGRPGSA